MLNASLYSLAERQCQSQSVATEKITLVETTIAAAVKEPIAFSMYATDDLLCLRLNPSCCWKQRNETKSLLRSSNNLKS
jgi:hypothetical protein